MAGYLERRRALVAATDQARNELRELFETDPLKAWDLAEAESLEQARFYLQMAPCDVLVLDESLIRSEEPDSISWIATLEEAPVVLLAEPNVPTLFQAFQNGVQCWLPRGLALTQPRLLVIVLDQAARAGNFRRQARATATALSDCRQQVGRLVGLLWDALPGPGQPPWLTQRHVLERLQEEVARSTRHGDPLTVVLGELQMARRERPSAEESQRLSQWSAQCVGRAKRRGDVAGQYGPHGFLLLLPHTSALEAVQCCRRLRDVLEKAPPGELVPAGPLNACFGIASFGPTLSTAKALLSRAEERLEQAKAGIGERIEM
jgi:diguanylate cyclase (GGDEF)-like protein